MCSPSMPEPPPPPPAPPDFSDENIALAKEVEQDRNFRMFAGLSSSIRNAATGTLRGPTRTTAGVK